MIHTKTTIHLYNGYKMEFPRKATRFELLCELAKDVRVSPNLFKFGTLFCNQSYCLPYSKKNPDAHIKGSFHYRFPTPLLNVEDIVHQCPEAFNYIYLQSVDDLKTNDGSLENIARVLAVKLSELGISDVSEVMVNYLLPVLGFASVSVGEIMELVSESLLKCSENLPAVKCKLIKNVTEQNRKRCIFDCSTDATQHIRAEITKSSLLLSDYEIILTNIDKVQFNFKHHSATIVTAPNSRHELTFSSRTSVESFLTLLDMAYKITSPGNLILDHKLSDDFHSESLIYHDPEFVIAKTAEDRNKHPQFNYSLVDQCSYVMKIENADEAEQILRSPGNESKFLVTDNFLVKEPVKILSQYYFFMVIGDRFRSRRIEVKEGGRFKIDNQHGYLSLIKLFNQINFMDKTDAVKKKMELKDPVTCEDLMQIAEHKSIYNTKREPTLSPMNVALSPNPSSYHYLYIRHTGVLHSPKSVRPVSVTQFVTHNMNYGSSILVPLIEHIKGLHTNGISHQNLAEFVGVYRVNQMPCIVEESFSTLLNVRLSMFHHSVEQLYLLGKQIVAGILYLHEKRIVHGFPVMHNISICQKGIVKLRFVGILPELIKRRDVYNPLLLREYLPHLPHQPHLPHLASYGHPARWLHRSMIFSNAPWNIEVDR